MVTPEDEPRLDLSGHRMPVPLPHERLDRRLVLACEPVPHSPEYDSVDAPEAHRCVVGKPVERCPTGKFEVEAFDHFNLVHFRIASKLRDKLAREGSDPVAGYRARRPHRSTRPSFSDDPVPKENKAVVDVRNMGFLHIQRQLGRAFQELQTFRSDGLCIFQIGLFGYAATA